MPNFKGLNTIDQYKKFTLTDRDLIKRDLLNSFLIREGEMPGRPEVGTSIWSFIFEPIDSFTTSKIEQEVRRIVERDTRIQLHEIKIYTQDNVIRVELSVSLLPGTNAQKFYINFLKDTNTATIS